MGVAGAGPFIRRRQQDLQARRTRLQESGLPDIQTRHPEIEQAFTYISSENAQCDDLDLIIDFWASMRGRFITLCNTMVCPSTLISISGGFYPSSTPIPLEEAPSAILDELMRELRARVEIARRSFKDRNLNVTIVFDNPLPDVQAKFIEKLKRSSDKQLCLDRYNRAYKRLEELSKKIKQGTYRKSGRDTQQANLPRRYGKRTMRSEMRAQFKVLRNDIWTQVSVPTSVQDLQDSLQRLGLQDQFQCLQEVKPDFPQSDVEDKLAAEDNPLRLLGLDIGDDDHSLDYGEDVFGIPTPRQVDDLHDQWTKVNRNWISDLGKVKIVVAADEADMTILNILAVPRKGCSILLSNDSDFCFFPENGHLDYMVSFSSHQLRKTPKTPWLSRKPWHVTNIAALHSSLIWEDREARILACLFAGHDYTGSGLDRVGLQSLSSKNLCLNGGLFKTLCKIVKTQERPNNRSGFWQTAAEQLSRNTDAALPIIFHPINRIAHALRIILLRTHRPLTEEHRKCIVRARATSKTTPTSIAAVNPFSRLADERRNIELLWKRSRDRTVIRPAQNEEQRLKTTTQLARSPDYSLPHKRHNAWVYDGLEPEKTRPRKLPPGYVELALASTSKEDDDDGTQKEIREPKDSSLEVTFIGEDDSEQADEEEEGDGAVATMETGSRRSKAAGEGDENMKDDGVARRDVAIQLPNHFPVRTHARWLPSQIRSWSRRDQLQNKKPVLHLIQMSTFAEKLSLKQTIVPAYNEYFERLYNRPEYLFLYQWRHFFAKRLDNEVTLFRAMVNMWSSDRPTQKYGAPPFFSFLMPLADIEDSDWIEAKIISIAATWKKLHVTSSQSEEEANCIQTFILDRLRKYDLRVIAFLSRLPGQYDIAMGDMMDDYAKGTALTGLIPIARFSNNANIDHGTQMFLAWKSKLKNRPLQEALSGYLMALCQEIAPAQTGSNIARLHVGIFYAFIGTPVESWRRNEVHEESKLGLEQAESVVGKKVVATILERAFSILDMTLQSNCRFLSMADFFRGKEKLQFGLKHLKMFFIRIGYQFSFDYDPTFLSWPAGRIDRAIRSAVLDVTQLCNWFNTYHLPLLSKSTAQITGSIGWLDEAGCFEHNTEGRNLLQTSKGQSQLRVAQWWTDAMQGYQTNWSTTMGPQAFGSERLKMFDLLFKRCIPNAELWAGSFSTDGFNLRILSIDPTRFVYNKSIEKKLPSIDFKRAGMNCYDFVTALFDGVKQSATTVETFGSVSHKLLGMQANPSEVVSSGSFASRTLRSKTVDFVQDLPAQRTRKGLPVDWTRLDGRNYQQVRQNLQKWADNQGDGHAIIAGVDLGIAFSQAIHVNRPAKPYECLTGSRAGVPKTTSSNSSFSKTFVVSPHALHEITRRLIRRKQSLRAQLCSSFLPCSPSKDPDQILRVSNMLDTSLKSGKHYCEASFRSLQCKRRFFDRIAVQFRELAWPELARGAGNPVRDSKDVGKLSPLVIVVGDGCELGGGSRGFKVHGADSATLGLRELVKRLLQWRLPVKVLVVDEAYTSQVCPDPNCKTSTSNEEAIQGLRSLMFKTTYRGGRNTCQRVLQCETCKRCFHRDVSAAMNIGFVAWHLMTHGRHPWRRQSLYTHN